MPPAPAASPATLGLSGSHLLAAGTALGPSGATPAVVGGASGHRGPSELVADLVAAAVLVLSGLALLGRTPASPAPASPPMSPVVPHPDDPEPQPVEVVPDAEPDADVAPEPDASEPDPDGDDWWLQALAEAVTGGGESRG